MIRSALALALLAAASLSAQATTVVEASSSSTAQGGQQPATSFAHVRNGELVDTNFAAPNGSSSAGPIGAGVTSAFADTTQIDGAMLANAFAAADLATGALRNYAEAGAAAGFSTALAYSTWTEGVTFHNTTDDLLTLQFFWETSGTVTDLNGTSIGSQNIVSGIELRRTDSSAVSLQGLSPGVLGGAQFNYGTFGGAGVSFFTFAPAGNNDAGAWTTSSIDPWSGLISATLLLPPGEASIDIIASLSLDCRTGAICDYQNTSTFRFGALPDGLTWTSDSGVFLSAVPIPATAWLLAGALAGLRVTRRRHPLAPAS